MKHTFAILLISASAAAVAQTAPKPAAPAATAHKPTSTAAASTGMVLPPGVPKVHGILKTAFALKYQDIKIGTGADAEPNKLYKVHYTGWLASDGHKFDSSYDHPRQPVTDKDGKPVMGDDGKPKLGDPQPLAFPQGFGRLIPGWDQGFYGMKVGGKRRLFIPWQLAYGARGRPGPDADHPGIPAKADLIFDVELVDVSDLPMPPNRGGMPGRPMPGGMPARPGGAPGQPAAPATPGQAPAAPASPSAGQPAPAATPAPATPPQPAPQPQSTPQPQPK